MIAVMQAAGDDGPLRGDAREKVGPRGSDAAVVAHFEKRALQIGLREHGLLHGSLGIALKQDRGCTIGRAHHERIVVGGLGSWLVVAEGRENGDAHGAERERVASAQGAHSDVEIGGFGEQCIIRGEVRIVAEP